MADGDDSEGYRADDSSEGGSDPPCVVAELPQPKPEPKFKGRYNLLSRLLLL